MMTLQRSWLYAAVFLALGAATVDAQPPEGRRGQNGRRGSVRFFPFGGRGAEAQLTSLAAMPQVQQELKISSEQKELLESLQADLFYQVRSTFRGGFRPPNSPRNAPQNRRQLQDSLRNRFTKLGEQGDDLLKTILEPDQTERLEQLRLQREGARAFDREEFVKAIGLDETQRKEIRELRDAATQRTRQQRRPTGEQEKAIAAMLTDQQKDQWEAMKGEPFKFPPRRSRFGRRGGGRGEGNRNRPQRPGPDE